jgi:hypothetical protein
MFIAPSGRLAHVVGELHDVLGVEDAVAIGRGHVPVLLGKGRRSGQREGRNKQAVTDFHDMTP